MAEYIKREDVLALETVMVDPDGFEHSCVLSVDVRSATAVDVAPVVHGYWKVVAVSSGQRRYKLHACSVCGRRNGTSATPYCSEWGARMDGD